MDLPLTPSRDGQWSAEFVALARACGGAILFGIPLLFTMEMWWIGEYQPRQHLLALVGLAFLANVALAYLSGFRHHDAGWRSDVAQAVEALGVGIVVSCVVLAALDRIDHDTSIDGIIGMVAVQVVPLSLGATVGNIVFDPSSGRTGEGGGPSRAPLAELGNDVAATFVGAMFLGFAIAPTDEIPMIASSLEPWNLLAVVAMSLLASYVIVFASGFDPSHRQAHVGGLFQAPFSETMLSYVVSLVAAFVLLIAFGQVSLGSPLEFTLRELLVLGVPAAIGGAAGRVVV